MEKTDLDFSRHFKCVCVSLCVCVCVCVCERIVDLNQAKVSLNFISSYYILKSAYYKRIKNLLHYNNCLELNFF